jgi:hypothetical protein
MQIDLINIDEFVKLNKLQEVTNPVIFAKGSTPTSNGLLSTEIFGISSNERKLTYAYVNLHGHFFQPYIYKILKRVDSRFEKIMYGTKRYKIDNGNLIEDDDGETGLEFLYKNWDKLKLKYNKSSIRGERLDVLKSHDKDTLFCSKWIIIPAFYRDANFQNLNTGKIAPHEITEKYSKLLRYVSVLSDNNNFDFILDSTKSKVQEVLVEIYDLIKGRLDKKNGLIRKSLLGKSIDYGDRSVISAPVFHANRPSDMPIDFDHSGIPLAQCCSMFTPFFIGWVRRFFEREFQKIGSKYPVKQKNGEIEYVELDNPDIYFNDEYIEKNINKFVFSYTDRFKKIEIPVRNYKEKVYFNFSSKIYNKNNPESETPINRPMTWCDLLYIAAIDITKDKIIWVTRYPITDYFSTFPNKIHVLTTKKTIPMYVNGTVYEYYPVIDTEIDKNSIGLLFLDTVCISNLYLKGLNGDYDGDQVSVRAVYSQESNEEGLRILNSISHIINITGTDMRTSSNESIQTMYSITKFT